MKSRNLTQTLGNFKNSGQSSVQAQTMTESSNPPNDTAKMAKQTDVENMNKNHAFVMCNDQSGSNRYSTVHRKNQDSIKETPTDKYQNEV